MSSNFAPVSIGSGPQPENCINATAIEQLNRYLKVRLDPNERIDEIGVLVPLYDFYPSIESFLDTAVEKTIDQAETNPGLEPFDIYTSRGRD